MHPDPPFKQILAELMIRGSIGSFAFSFWELDIEPYSKVPPGPCFLYGNHCNNYDPFLVNMFTQLGTASSGVMTMEYLESGPLATVFSWLGLEGTRKRVPEPHLIRRIYRMLDAGRRVLIYPEGGRRWDGRPGSWIESTAKLFHRASVPVHPVLTHGSYVSWPRWARWPRPANVRIEVLPAVDFTGAVTTADAVERLAAPIDIDENIVPEERRPRWAWRPAEGVGRLLYRDPVTGEFDGLRSADGRGITGPDERIRWEMLPDSRLLDPRTGAVTTTADVYDEVRRLPLDPDRNGVIIGARCEIVRSPERASGFVHGSARQEPVEVRLGPDFIRIARTEVSLSDIEFIGLERNDILWLITSHGRYDLHFDFGGSVLAFYDTMLRLSPDINPGERRPSTNDPDRA